MFGYFRFFLATLVVISHLGITFEGANPGVAAVVCFYMLAGFVVSHLFLKVFISQKPLYLRFYYERALRIFPLYLFVAAITLIFIIVTGFGSAEFGIKTLVNNLLIIPLNYYMVLDNAILQDPKWWLIPPAWSLGVELQAYLLLPFIVYFKGVKIVLAVISLTVFSMASLGVIDSDYFGYRLLIGVLFLFILGVSISKSIADANKADLFDRYFPAFVYAYLILLLIISGLYETLHYPYVRETIFGVLLGMPTIIYLSKSKVTLPLNSLLGEFSYGIFLSHFLMIWIVEFYSLVDKSTHIFLYVLLIFLASLLLSIVGVFMLERSVKKYRILLGR